VTIDARPSDAHALALRLHRPIFVDEAVFAAGGGDGSTHASRAFGLTLQDLTPELAEGLALRGVRGALTGVDGESVASAAELVSQLERRRNGQAMRVALRRQGQPLEVRIRVGAAPPRDR
jgi:S1-C subfamily serine protease